jgi:putative ATP-dependent endonuclease of OLD family
MYISKIAAFNFRSLKHVEVRFENGKNVLVGKNNSGKSNIIKGIELLVGEKFINANSISDNDFYACEVLDENTGELFEERSENLYLEATLQGRDIDEELIKTMKKQTAFSKVKNSNCIFPKEGHEYHVNYDFFQSLDEIEKREEIEEINGRKTVWKKPQDLIDFLKVCRRLKIFCCKSRLDDEKFGYGLLCQLEDGSIWISHYLNKKLKDSLVTTTVISALRSHKEDLRIVSYSWFGKLILGLWDKNKKKIDTSTQKTFEELIVNQSKGIKELVDIIFQKDTKEIRELLEGAIAHKSISFRFISDSSRDLYKNIQLFVNDGIDSPLTEKGTGIQSAIIISLFSLYCNEYHNNSSLLVAEEPELFLHPQARRLISAELDKFLKGNDAQPRQLIISTHSIEYLKNVDPYNIARVYKDKKSNESFVKQLDKHVSDKISVELKRFLWSNNTELFFADKVILVEGGEVYIIPSLVDNIRKSKQLLDYKNITVSRVNGKGSFLIYVKMLQCFDIPFIILGDLDCFKDEVPKLVAHLKMDDIQEVVRSIQVSLSAMVVDQTKFAERVRGVDKNFDAQALQGLLERFQNGEIQSDDADLAEIIEYMKSRYTKGDRENAILEQIGENDYKNAQSSLRKNGIFIWSKGDLESCYTDTAKQIEGGKDIKALHLSYLLQEDDCELSKYFKNIPEIIELIDCIIGEPSQENRAEIDGALVEVLD